MIIYVITHLVFCEYRTCFSLLFTLSVFSRIMRSLFFSCFQRVWIQTIKRIARKRPMWTHYLTTQALASDGWKFRRTFLEKGFSRISSRGLLYPIKTYYLLVSNKGDCSSKKVYLKGKFCSKSWTSLDTQLDFKIIEKL